MKTIIGAIIATFAFAGAANALDIQNQDTVAHEVYLHGDSVKRTVTLQPGQWVRDACNSNICTFMLDNNPANWNAGENETYIIKDNKLEMQPRG